MVYLIKSDRSEPAWECYKKGTWQQSEICLKTQFMYSGTCSPPVSTSMIFSDFKRQDSKSHNSHLHEREDEAHSEVGHPVKWTSNYVGCWAVGLFKQLRSYQEGDPRWNRTSTNEHEINITLMCLWLIKQYAFRTDRIILSGLCGWSKQTPQTKTFMFYHKLKWHNSYSIVCLM